MSGTTLTSSRPATGRRTLGLLGLAGGLIGAAQGLLVLSWPAAVDEQRYSYPFGPAGYSLAQVSFAAQHLLLLAAVLALTALPAVNRSRAGRLGAWVAVIGLALLAVLELVAVTVRDEPLTSGRAELITNLYALPTILIGLGLLLAGGTALRAGRLPGAPWLPAAVLATGAYVFLVLTPALMGPFAAGRLGLVGWMALFAVVGLGLVRSDQPDR